MQPTLREGIPAPDDSELPDFLRDDDDDERPTLVQDSPLVDEDELPDFLRDDTDLDYLEDPGQPTMISTAPSGPPDALAPPDLGAPSGGDGSELVLPKTEILALPEAPGGPAQPPGIGPPPAVGFQPGPQPSEDPSGSQSSSSGLQWLMWVGIGAGALVLLVTTVLLAITLAS